MKRFRHPKADRWLKLVLLAPLTLFAVPILTRLGLGLEPLEKYSLDPDVPGQCFALSRVAFTAPCAPCVYFVTHILPQPPWNDTRLLARSLQATAGALRSSQTCFTLTAYTTAVPGSTTWMLLASAGGIGVELAPYPTLASTGKHAGPDLLGQYESHYGREAVWIGRGVLLTADLACAYARAPAFAVAALSAPGQVRDDLWMADAAMLRQMRSAKVGVEEFLSRAMSRCDGTLVDLRALVRSDGFGDGWPMCMGADFGGRGGGLVAEGGKIYCELGIDGKRANYTVASLSYRQTEYARVLERPETYFSTPELAAWASTVGIA